jgi:hypothetical protein
MGIRGRSLRSLDETSWEYTVTIRNQTTDTFDSIDAFYKRIGQTGLVYLTDPQVNPGDITVFRMGPCKNLESYVIAFVIQGNLVASIPPQGQGNMTPARASAESTGDVFLCQDSWRIVS